jgi:hypothetical protein
MSLPTPAFDSVRLGTDRHAFTVQLLRFPRSDAPLLEKVQAFAYFEEVIRQHRPQLTSLTVQQAYADNIPVSSSASASEEANRVSCQLYESFFEVANLDCLGFYASDGSKASIAIAPCDRSPDIAFVHFEATISPAACSPALSSVPSATAKFFLRLPQSTLPAKPAASSSEPPIIVDDPHDAPATATPDTAQMTAVRKAFASGTVAASLDFDNPSVVAALASIVKISSAEQEIDDIFTPKSTKRQLFHAPRDPPAVTSPSIRRYLTTASSSAIPSFAGTLDFLDSQSLFDGLFPPLNRQPIYTLHQATTSITTVDETTATNAIQRCLSDCRLLVFQSVIRLDYIGHHNFASSDHLQMTVKRLRHLTLKFNTGRGVTVDGNPDMLFDKYLALIPLLPATHVNTWGINLFTQFWNALGDELTRRITQLPRYIDIQSSIFDLTTMTSKARQMTALRELRSLAVTSWNSIQDDKRSMRALIREVSGNNRSSNHITEATTHISSAEATIQRYASDDPAPHAAIQTNHQFPSTTAPGGPVSDFPPDFRGCLGCGGDHVFRSCPMRKDPATVDRFHKNFNIKFNRPQQSGPRQPPSRDPPSPYGPSTSVPRPPGSPPSFGPEPTPNSGSGRGAHRHQPAWMTQQHHSRTNDTLANPDSASPNTSHKKPRNYALFVRSCQQQVSTSPALRPMPIRVDNGLPHLRLNLGLSAPATLSVLFDSGAALSSGYLPYHLWIMRQNPETVASFERFDDANPFEPIKLGGAIRHPDDYNESVHGQLTAIIRYKTPYVDHNGRPVRISFGLGNDMTVNTILGMPIIKDLGMIPNFRDGSVVCEDTAATFTLRYHATSCGFLADDNDAAVFSALPVTDMYPSAATSDFPSPALPDDPCVDATDDHTKGFLQRNLN